MWCFLTGKSENEVSKAEPNARWAAILWSAGTAMNNSIGFTKQEMNGPFDKSLCKAHNMSRIASSSCTCGASSDAQLMLNPSKELIKE